MALIAFASSPRGRRMIGDARRRFDTPENRAKAMRLKDQAMARGQARRGGGTPAA